jgi:hypothetical protein
MSEPVQVRAQIYRHTDARHQRFAQLTRDNDLQRPQSLGHQVRVCGTSTSARSAPFAEFDSREGVMEERRRFTVWSLDSRIDLPKLFGRRKRMCGSWNSAGAYGIVLDDPKV